MRWVGVCAILGGVCLLAGCASGPPAQKDRPDDALKDPMNYSVNMDNTDITGGDVGTYDSKAMKRDVDDFLNP
jgi:hypothetical protein